jgi:catechol 2,3-dioxygenase
VTPPPAPAAAISQVSPIWPSLLDHVFMQSDDPAGLADFYARALGFAVTRLGDGEWLLSGPGRRLLVAAGPANGRACHAYRVESAGQLDEIRRFLREQAVAVEASPSPLFEDDAVAVRDPDGWLSVFGLPRDDDRWADAPAATPPARLQHVVVASPNLPEMIDFYENRLGFVASDYCNDDLEDPATRRAAFYRTDPEHHSFAIFGASAIGPDHHAYETSCWNDIRDWADHMSRERIKIWWGPGRHGPGNNLFFMIRDPHGHSVELSAELEHMPRDMAPRVWPLDERSLNLWGPGWIRE